MDTTATIASLADEIVEAFDASGANPRDLQELEEVLGDLAADIVDRSDLTEDDQAAVDAAVEALEDRRRRMTP